MLPASIRHLLNRLAARERLLGFCWVFARGVSLCLVVFALACLTDWLIDRRQDTPWLLRVGLLVAQALLWLVVLVAILRSVLRRWSDDELALWVERQVPELGQRLISAVQFQRPEAQEKIRGMSPDLIAAVTHQAQERAATIRPQDLVDARRLQWSASLLLPVLLCGVVLVAIAPQTCAALAARAFLADRDIPRSVQLLAVSHSVWPTGEEGVLEFQVLGHVEPDVVGLVRLEPEEGPAIHLGLLASERECIWQARVPAGDIPFRFRAWLGDGRLREPGEVRYAPRPVLQSLQAWVQLPSRVVGTRAGGQPFEEPQRGGDIVYRMEGCQARLLVRAQVPLEGGEVRISGKNSRTVTLKPGSEPQTLEAVWPLLSGDDSYRVVVRDGNGFENADPPRRSIRELPLEPVEVVLLPETFAREGDTGPLEDREVEGIPILLGQRFRLEYRCAARYGLSHAQLRYRVLPRSSEGDSGEVGVSLDQFLPLPLGPGRDHKGPVSDRLREEFFLKPAASPDDIAGTQGGGRYDFSSTGIPDGKGGLLQLREGDRIQFFVEVFDRARPDGPAGRSAVREKEVVNQSDYLTWLTRKEDLKERTRTLEEQQRQVRP